MHKVDINGLITLASSRKRERELIKCAPSQRSILIKREGKLCVLLQEQDRTRAGHGSIYTTKGLSIFYIVAPVVGGGVNL